MISAKEQLHQEKTDFDEAVREKKLEFENIRDAVIAQDEGKVNGK